MNTENRKQTDLKQRQDIEGMFDSIAGRYDFLNHFLSFGADMRWRRSAIKKAGKLIKPSTVLDVATGTGDFALDALRLNPEKVTGIDLSGKMLERGMVKLKRKNLEGRVEMLKGDSLHLPFGDESFDLVMSAFGVRNFSDVTAGVAEMTRVARKNGVLLILEFSRPENRIFRTLFHFYFFRVLPVIGHFLSGHSSAYRYLPESVGTFPKRQEFITILERAGLSEVKSWPLTGGIAVVYTGKKN